MVRKVVALSCFLGTCTADIPGERDWTQYSFDKYLQDFGKVYNGVGEHRSRQSIFESNLAFINEHNADASKTWFATVNEFTDWTSSEFRAKRAHGTKSKRTSGSPIQDTASPKPLLVSDEGLPAKLDWRSKSGVVTPVKNQGGCGSCWAFSATETMESALAIATGEAAPILSPQQIVSCAPNPQQCGGTGGCDGSTQPLAFDYTKTAGLTLESDYHYTARTGTCNKDKIVPVAQNTGYVELPKNNYTSLMNAVANVGPIAISVAAGGMGWQTYGGGVLSTCGWDQDHAVQLVGYGTDNSDYWLVRNSWGESWGEKGYIRIKRFGEGKEPCGTDTTPQDGSACKGDTKPETLCGVCGILSDSSYPTGLKKVGPSPGPSPPGPSPPSPSPTQCTAAMANACDDARSSGGPAVCRGCCMSHDAELSAAGCTQDAEEAWCSADSSSVVV